MMRKIWSLVAVGIMVVTPVVAQAETLADALASAYRNSQLLEQNQAALRARDEDFAFAVGALLPVFGYTAQIAASQSFGQDFRGNPLPVNSSTTLSLVAQMTLVDFGRGQAEIEARRALVQAAQHSLIGAEQSVLFDAVNAYVQVKLRAELVAAQDSNVRVITRDLGAARDRFEVGEVTRTDVALAEAQLASAKAALAAAQGDYNSARETYKATIGHYPGKLSALPKPPSTAENVEKARAIALRNHPVILQLQSQVKAQELFTEQARREMLPEINGRATLGQTFTGGTQENITESVQITMSQTLYQGGQLSSRLRNQIATTQQTQAQLMQNGILVDQEVGTAWSNILVANASIRAGDEQIRAAQAAYDGVRQEAELGSRTTLDVLDAEQELLSAKATRLQSGANLYVSHYRLLSAMGLLTARHLKLNVPLFDPNAYFNAVKKAPATTARGARLDRILKTLGK